MEDLWLAQAKRLLALAQTGQQFTRDEFDRERYQEIEAIAHHMLAQLGRIPLTTVAQLFATGETVECWAPVGVRESLHDAYECPNDKCYRVVDPANDVELYAETAAGYLYGAWACLALALIGFCAIAVCSSEGACLCAEGGPKVGMRNTNSRTHPGD